MLKKFVPIIIVGVVLSLAACSAPAGPAKPGGSAPGGSAPGTTGKAGATGCGLVTASEVSKISGVTFSRGVSSGPQAVTPTKQIPVVSNQSCSYKISDDVYVQYFLNTLSVPAAAYEANVWKADEAEDPAQQTTVDGLPALLTTQSGGDLELVFYKGQIVVQVNTAGVSDGTAEAVALLVAKRM